jgi:hypothetical protein
MTGVSVVPDVVRAASGNLANLGSALRSANAAAAAQTTAIAVPGGDEVSAAITALFGKHAQEFQALNAQAATFHDEFVNLMNGGAAQYVNAELANAQQTAVDAVNAPAQALLGHPLITTGAGQGAAAANTPGVVFSLDTPFGPIQLSELVVSGDPFANGPHTFTSGLTSPFFSLAAIDNVTVSGGGSVLQYTGGTAVLPPVIPLSLAALGPYVTGGASFANYAGAFVAAATSGNPVAAATALLSMPSNVADAVLFGHETITISPGGEIGDPASPHVQLHIPFGGLFASLEPLSSTYPQTFTGVESAVNSPYNGMTQTVLASNFSYQGAQFGGFFPELLYLSGLPS